MKNYFSLIFIFLFIFSANAKRSEIILSERIGKHSIKVFFFSSQRTLLVKLEQRNKVEEKESILKLKIDNYSSKEVEKKVLGLIKKVTLDREVLENYKNFFSGFKYLEDDGLKVKHFDINKSKKKTFINKLIKSSVEKERSIVRSQKIDSLFKGSAPLDLYLIVNKNNEVVKLSLVGKKEIDKEYKVSRADDYFYIEKRSNGRFLLFKLQNNRERWQFSRLSQKRNGLTNVQNKHFDLISSNYTWKKNEVSSSEISPELVEDSLLLSRSVQFHRAVAKFPNEDIYIKTLDRNTIKKRIRFFFKDLTEYIDDHEFDVVLRKTESFFFSCMIEKMKLDMRNGLDHEKAYTSNINDCGISSYLQVALEVLRNVTSEQFSYKVTEKQFNEYIDETDLSFRSCLVSNNLLRQINESYVLDTDLLKKSGKNRIFLSLRRCIEDESVQLKIREFKISKKDDVLSKYSFVRDNEVDEILKLTVDNNFKTCLKDKKRNCLTTFEKNLMSYLKILHVERLISEYANSLEEMRELKELELSKLKKCLDRGKGNCHKIAIENVLSSSLVNHTKYILMESFDFDDVDVSIFENTKYQYTSKVLECSFENKIIQDDYFELIEERINACIINNVKPILSDLIISNMYKKYFMSSVISFTKDGEVMNEIRDDINFILAKSNSFDELNERVEESSIMLLSQVLSKHLQNILGPVGIEELKGRISIHKRPLVPTLENYFHHYTQRFVKKSETNLRVLLNQILIQAMEINSFEKMTLNKREKRELVNCYKEYSANWLIIKPSLYETKCENRVHLSRAKKSIERKMGLKVSDSLMSLNDSEKKKFSLLLNTFECMENVNILTSPLNKYLTNLETCVAQ